jgi:hypothetical protein
MSLGLNRAGAGAQIKRPRAAAQGRAMLFSLLAHDKLD